MKTRALAVISLGVAAFAFGCTAGPDESHLGSTKNALTAEQCTYFSVGGKTRICHATGSARNPFVILAVSDAACVDAHAGHAADYVAAGDSTCNGQGCLPEDAPSDPTLPCCDGLSPQSGICRPTDRCLGVTCTPRDQCHVSTCDPDSGLCVEAAKVEGFPCDDGLACTTGDACRSGVCAGGPKCGVTRVDECTFQTGQCDATSGECDTASLRCDSCALAQTTCEPDAERPIYMLQTDRVTGVEGSPLHLEILGFDNNPTDTVTIRLIQVSPMPPSLRFGPLDAIFPPASGNPVVSALNWTPEPGDAHRYEFTFDLSDGTWRSHRIVYIEVVALAN